MALPSTYKQIAINQQSPARKCYIDIFIFYSNILFVILLFSANFFFFLIAITQVFMFEYFINLDRQVFNYKINIVILSAIIIIQKFCVQYMKIHDLFEKKYILVTQNADISTILCSLRERNLTAIKICCDLCITHDRKVGEILLFG